MDIENKYDRIRTILGADSTELPDMIIDYPEYYGAAENWAKQRVPDWEQLTEDKKPIFELCVLYKTASLLIPYCQSTINVKLEQTTHSKIEYADGREKNHQSIRDMLAYYLAELVPPTPFYGFDLSGRL